MAVSFTLAFVVLLLAAAAHAVTSFGYVLLSVPLLAIIFDPHTAVASSVAAATIIAVTAWRREHRHVDVGSLRWLALAGLAGIPLGLWVFSRVAEHILLVLIGAITIVTTVVLAARVRLPSGRTTDVMAGLASGVLVTTTGTNGPPLVLALHTKRLAPRVARATLQALFTVQGVVAVIGLGIAGQITWLVTAILALSIVATFLGWRIGDAVFHRLSAEQVRAVILMVLLGSGATLLVRGLGS